MRKRTEIIRSTDRYVRACISNVLALMKNIGEYKMNSKSTQAEIIQTAVSTPERRDAWEREEIYSGARSLLDAFTDAGEPNIIHMMDIARGYGLLFIASEKFKSAMCDLVIGRSTWADEKRFSASWLSSEYISIVTSKYPQSLYYRPSISIDSIALEFLKLFRDNRRFTCSLTRGPAHGFGFVVIASDELLNAMAPHLDTDYLRQFHASVVASSKKDREKLIASMIKKN